ncbi:MAG: hypothetical protein Q9174_000064 [Haloplaca sp. 1 TL-2023]
MALNFAAFVSGLASVIFICTPISFFWNQTGHGHCVNIVALLYSGASLGIFMDIAVFVLPMPIVWTLQMKRSKKIGIMGVFLLGGLTKRSGDASTYAANVSDPRKQFSTSLQQKPVVSVTTVYSRETQSDEEMAMPLREIEGQR